jgi:LysR family nitrogen assimilation transcriptional regulator
MAIDLVQLRYFMRVAELKSFTKAAASLHIAQPAVTRQIRLLEEEMGVQLLFRHSRGAEPTEAGMRLLAGAETLFRLLHEIRADVVATSALVSGTLRIGFPPSLGDLLVGTAVSAFRERYPDVVLNLQEGYSQALRDSLLGDRMDLAVLTGRQANPLLVATHLCDEQLWILRPPGSAPPRRGKAYAFPEIAQLPLIQPSRANTLRQMIEARAAELDLALNVVVEAEALHMIKDLVRRGVGCHVSPYSGVGADIERGDFAGGPVRGLAVSRFLVRRIDRPVSLALTRFQEILTDTLVQVQRETGGAISLP